MLTLQAQQEHNEWMCEYYEYQANCDGQQNNNNGGRRLDEEMCLWDYLSAIEGFDPYTCVDKNPYNDDEAEEEAFDFADWMECAEAKIENQNGNNNNNNNNNGEEVQYFMGPYCSDNGGAIYLGLFTDDQCTIFADEYGGKETYYTLSGGQTMPFYATSVIDYDCISCKEPEDFNNDGNDAEDADEVIEVCEQIYAQAGKCETELANLESRDYFQHQRMQLHGGYQDCAQERCRHNRTLPRPTRLPLSLLAFSLLPLSSSLRTSTTSRPSSTVHRSTLPSKLMA